MLILKHLGRAWGDAQQERFGFNAQVDHPLGVPDFAYPAELSLRVVLFDTTGELTELKRETQTYPPALSSALPDRLWEADFLLNGVRKSMARAAPVWVAGCLCRVVLLCVHALHGHAGRWLINEKGALNSTERLSVTPPGVVDRARDICGSTGQHAVRSGSHPRVGMPLVEGGGPGSPLSGGALPSSWHTDVDDGAVEVGQRLPAAGDVGRF